MPDRQSNNLPNGRQPEPLLDKLLDHIHSAIPEGRSLPEDVWQRRHRGFLVLLWLHALALPAFALAKGSGWVVVLAAAGFPAVSGLVAGIVKGHRKLQASLVSLGFLTSSAMLVFISGGYIEMHFHYFVMVTLLALYQDWTPFLLAIGYVLLQHGVGGLWMPQTVYNHPDAWMHPWKWAIIHATFLSAACVGSLVAWRVNERHHARTQLLLNSMAEGLYGLDLNGRIVFANSAAAKLTGYSVAELLNQSPHRLLHHSRPDGTPYPEEDCPIHAVLPDGETRSVVGDVYWRKDGTNFSVECRCNPIKDRGRVVGATITFFDISERERDQKSLRLYRKIITDADYAISILDLQGRFTYQNDAHASLVGYGNEELIGRTPALFLGEDNFAGLVRELSKSGRYRGELTARTKDGAEKHLDLSVFTMSNAAGEPQCLVGIKRDITERKRLEAQLLQSQKMEGLGRLAGGIAHDFNNILTVINGYSVLLQQSLPEHTSHWKDVKQIKQASERAATLTNQLLAFSRQQVLQPSVLDINTVMAQMDQLLRRLIGEDKQFRTILGASVGRIKADKGQLDQVILNLAVNARDAMPDGGQLTIETQNVEVTRAQAARHAGIAPGRFVMLAVSDTGVGMDPATRAHVFEPFFTTKEQGKGTGLGLATAYGIVQQSGGFIELYSEVGKGTTFKVYLPQADEAPKPVMEGDAEPRLVAGTEVILLVEDEDMVRELAHRLLRDLGYTVLEARNGEAALHQAESHRGPIHLLVTDMVMPGMGGHELVERLTASRPDTKVLYVSGYTSDTIARRWTMQGAAAFLQKPYDPLTLTQKVREVLDAKAH